MHPAVTAAFRSWLKGSNIIKLSFNSTVTSITYEGITNFDSLTDFDKTSIEYIPRTCKEKIIAIVEDLPAGITAGAEVAGANVGSIFVRRLIVATNIAQHYDSINRTTNTTNMHYTNVLSDFKVEEEAYTDLKNKPEPEAPSSMTRKTTTRSSRGAQYLWTVSPGHMALKALLVTS